MKVLVSLLLLLAAFAVPAQEVPEFHAQLAREVLPPNDGWAAAGNGTTGGSAATPDRVFVVTNRTELLASLSSGTAPRIIFVQGTIDLNDGMTCAGYAAGTPYTLDAYVAAYAPATWGRRVLSGTLESARVTARNRQQSRIRVNIPGNTTVIGLPGAKIVGAHVRINNVSNVIIRNLTFEDAYDCFPQWDPTDGSTGAWNSAYDNLSLTGATNVWIDHCEFNDGDHLDAAQPLIFNRPYQVHDGLLDITNASDLVTVSWNRFLQHDKVMLIGGSDSATADRNKLRVTLHHNVFDTNVQRAPRVRFGKVHVYNNYYAAGSGYSYSWGVGVESQIYAEDNYFETGGTVHPSRFIGRFNGNLIYAGETLVDGHSKHHRVDVVAAYNLVRNPDLSTAVTWNPQFVAQRHPTQALPGVVRHNAGPFRD